MEVEVQTMQLRMGLAIFHSSLGRMGGERRENFSLRLFRSLKNHAIACSAVALVRESKKGGQLPVLWQMPS